MLTENYRQAAQKAMYAAAYLEKARYAEAEALAEQCIQFDKQHAACYKTLSSAAHLQGRNDTALKAYETYLRLAQIDPETNVVKSYLKQLNGSGSAAAEAPPAEKSPPTARSKSKQAQKAFDLAAQFLRAKQFTEARKMASQCIVLAPDNAGCHLVLGSSHAGLGQWEQAAQSYRTFLSLAPDHKTAPKVRETLVKYEMSKGF